MDGTNLHPSRHRYDISLGEGGVTGSKLVGDILFSHDANITNSTIKGNAYVNGRIQTLFHSKITETMVGGMDDSLRVESSKIKKLVIKEPSSWYFSVLRWFIPAAPKHLYLGNSTIEEVSFEGCTGVVHLEGTSERPVVVGGSIA